MASGASRQDLRHVSPFSSGSGRRLAIEPQLLAPSGAIDPPAHAAPATPAPRAGNCAADRCRTCLRPGPEGSGETAEPVLVGAEENPVMGDRLIISDNREDPGNPLVLDGEAIDAAARDPLAIGKL